MDGTLYSVEISRDSKGNYVANITRRLATGRRSITQVACPSLQPIADWIRDKMNDDKSWGEDGASVIHIALPLPT